MQTQAVNSEGDSPWSTYTAPQTELVLEDDTMFGQH